MKYVERSVKDVYIFDMEGTSVATLNTLMDSDLIINQDNDEAYLVLKDALYDLDLLKFIGRENSSQSDYDRVLNINKNKITFGKRDEKECKIIAKGVWRKSENMEDIEVVFEIPHAVTVNNIKFEGSNHNVSTFDLVFKIIPFNEDGDLFNLHI